MLTWDKVLRHIKIMLGIPSGILEKTDEELKEFLIEMTIPFFSMYFPDDEITGIDTQDPNIAHPSKKGHFYLYDAEGLPIYGFKNVFFNASRAALGHPMVGPSSLEQMKGWALQVFKSATVFPYSNLHHTAKFIEPNIIRVVPGSYTGTIAIEYEREHPHDLSKIPGSMYRIFQDLCLADTKIMLGTLRTQFGDGRITTPFGEIPLNGDSLKNEGNEMRREIEEKLAQASLPPVVIDVG